jgi:hypothetical protein
MVALILSAINMVTGPIIKKMEEQKVYDSLREALDGEFERIDRDTVVLFPYGVDVETDIDELEEEIIEDSEDEQFEDDAEDLD